MARVVEELPPGARIADYIGLGVITKTFPLAAIVLVLSKTARASGASAICRLGWLSIMCWLLALYMHLSYREVPRCLLEGVQRLREPSAKVRVAGKRAGMDAYDRNLFGFELWQLAQATGAEPLWRLKQSMRMAGEKRLPDGFYSSHVYPSGRDCRHMTNGTSSGWPIAVLKASRVPSPFTGRQQPSLDPGKAPAGELAALYHERGEIETASTNSKPICVALKSCCPAKLPAWCGKCFSA